MPDAQLSSVVLCSLEEWDDVWRRNQFFCRHLLEQHPRLRLLFVEPPADPLHDITTKRVPRAPRFARVGPDRRVNAFRPLKPLPRRAGGFVDASLHLQVLAAAAALRISDPTLWLNDVTYAPLLKRTHWPSVYDVTDDWLESPATSRERQRLESLDRLALEQAGEVVVCSPNLAATRGRTRPVTLIPNGVDVDLFRRPQERPADLSPPPVAVYVGTLHSARLDLELVHRLATELPDLNLVFVGPDSLSVAERSALESHANVTLSGPRPYERVPAYLQHADVIVVPHVVSPFTESLDPIKAYECLAVETPTVATPVAGFREHADVFEVADASSYSAAVRRTLAETPRAPTAATPPTWQERAAAFEEVLSRVRTNR